MSFKQEDLNQKNLDQNSDQEDKEKTDKKNELYIRIGKFIYHSLSFVYHAILFIAALNIIQNYYDPKQ